MNNILDENNIQEEMFIFCSQFQSFSLWYADFISLGPKDKAGHHGGRALHRKAVQLMAARKWRERSQGHNIIAKVMSSVTYFLQLCPHLPIVTI